MLKFLFAAAAAPFFAASLSATNACAQQIVIKSELDFAGRLESAVASDNVSYLSQAIAEGAQINSFLKNGDTPATYALRIGSLKSFGALLSDPGFDVNASNRHGETPLMLAAYYGRSREFYALLSKGAYVNVPSGRWSPLHYATIVGQAKFAEILLQKGADPNAATKAGVAPLHLAAKSGSIECVELLLKHGADPGRRTSQGLSALDFAQKAGRSGIVEMLKGN